MQRNHPDENRLDENDQEGASGQEQTRPIPWLPCARIENGAGNDDQNQHGEVRCCGEQREGHVKQEIILDEKDGPNPPKGDESREDHSRAG